MKIEYMRADNYSICYDDDDETRVFYITDRNLEILTSKTFEKASIAISHAESMGTLM